MIQKAESIEQQVVNAQENIQLLGVIFVLIVMFLVGCHFYYLQKQRKAKLESENYLKEAIEIMIAQRRLQEQNLSVYKDLHDSIGSQLTFIISSVENLKYYLKDENPEVYNKIDAISLFARNTTFGLRDTIWAVNKDFVVFEDLKSRVYNFVDRINILSDNISFSLLIDDELLQTKINSSDGINLYRMIQDGIKNSIKHTQVTRISVTINQLKKAYQVTIKDNGINTDSYQFQQNNEIDNIRRRAEMVGASFTITSCPENGTLVSIVFKE
ncbi:MAG TPA: ATP-binding protein [Flavobacterium sp.]|nr:ATP-binding protein [Flavobacterium sp.]